jgi:nucleoid DNA-binding protein
MVAAMTTLALVVHKVQWTLGLQTKKEAEVVLNRVVTAIEQTLLEHLDTDGFALKLGSLGRFTVQHKPAHKRKNPFRKGDVISVPAKRRVRFVTYGALRELEKVKPSSEQQPSSRRLPSSSR